MSEKQKNSSSKSNTKSAISVSPEEIADLKSDPTMVDDLLTELRLYLLVYYKKLLSSGSEVKTSSLDVIRRLLATEGWSRDEIAKRSEELEREREMARELGDLPFP